MRINRPIKIVLFVFLLLSACAPQADAPEIAALTPTPKETGEPTAISTPGPTETSVPVATSGSDTIVLWHPFSGVEAETLETLVSEFNAKNLVSVTVVAEAHADEDVLIADFAALEESDEVPDIILAPSYFIRKLAAEETLIALDDAMLASENDEGGPGVFPVFSNVDVLDGTRFGVSYLQFGHFLFYQSSWADQIGVEASPSSLEAIRNISCEAFNVNRFDADLENNGTGGYFYPVGAMPLASWMRAFDGGAQFNSRGTLILDTEENRNALNFLFDLWNTDCAWWTNREQFPYRYFLEEKAILYSGRSDALIPQAALMEEMEGDPDWQLIPYPSQGGKPVILFNSYSFAMPQKEQPAVAGARGFMEWMLNEENHVEFVYSSGAFPLRSSEIQIVDREWALFPYWQQTVQTIPFLEPVSTDANWYLAEKVLEDLSWQLIQFAVTADDLPAYLQQAETIVNTVIFESTE